jgi:hypothetical protein
MVFLPITSEISAIKFEKDVFEWQGEKYPQGPDSAMFHYFKLYKIEGPEFLLSKFPENFKNEEWQCIDVSDGVDDVLEELSESTDIFNKNTPLYNLLSILTNGEKKWGIVFVPDGGAINEVVEGNIDMAFHKIIECFANEINRFVVLFERE